MTERNRPISDAALDRLITGTRTAKAQVPPDFLRALTEQAIEVMVTREAARLTPPVPVRPGWRARLAALADRMAPLLWPAGLAVPVLAGIWLGGWADSQGYLGAGSVAVSNLALDLGYRLPEVSALVGGY
jgi:hypothetical protein